MFYYEQRTFDGRWSPRTSPEKPDTVQTAGTLRLKNADGSGPKVRGIKEVPSCYLQLDLAQMQAVLGPDGHLQ